MFGELVFIFYKILGYCWPYRDNRVFVKKRFLGMPPWRRILTFFGLLFWIHVQTSSAIADLSNDAEVRYQACLGPLKIGEIRLSTTTPSDRVGAIQLRADIRSSVGINRIYGRPLIQSTLTSICQTNPWRSLEYWQERVEGKNRFQRIRRINYSNQTGSLETAGSQSVEKEGFSIDGAAFDDPLSMFYHLARADVGGPVISTVQVIENKKTLEMMTVANSNSQYREYWIREINLPAGSVLKPTILLKFRKEGEELLAAKIRILGPLGIVLLPLSTQNSQSDRLSFIAWAIFWLCLPVTAVRLAFVKNMSNRLILAFGALFFVGIVVCVRIGFIELSRSLSIYEALQIGIFLALWTYILNWLTSGARNSAKRLPIFRKDRKK